jgi:DNA-binding MarR family transcriptional regulator
VSAVRDLSSAQYRELAEFRTQIRRFLYFSEVTAKEHGIEAQQHQMLLAVRGLPADTKPTIRELAAALYIRHHSAVELINRLEKSGFIARQPGKEDRREVLVNLTTKGRGVLRRLALAHRAELERTGPELARALQSVLREGRRNGAA